MKVDLRSPPQGIPKSQITVQKIAIFTDHGKEIRKITDHGKEIRKITGSGLLLNYYFILPCATKKTRERVRNLTYTHVQKRGKWSDFEKIAENPRKRGQILRV